MRILLKSGYNVSFKCRSPLIARGWKGARGVFRSGIPPSFRKPAFARRFLAFIEGKHNSKWKIHFKKNLFKIFKIKNYTIRKKRNRTIDFMSCFLIWTKIIFFHERIKMTTLAAKFRSKLTNA